MQVVDNKPLGWARILFASGDANYLWAKNGFTGYFTEVTSSGDITTKYYEREIA